MATVAELKATRCYARSVLHQSMEEVIAGCVESVRRYGVSLPDCRLPRCSTLLAVHASEPPSQLPDIALLPPHVYVHTVLRHRRRHPEGRG